MEEAERVPSALRMKLDRRIHNQRMALRENWMIVDQRQRGVRKLFSQIISEVHLLCDALGVERAGDFGGNLNIFARMQKARAAIIRLDQVRGK